VFLVCSCGAICISFYRTDRQSLTTKRKRSNVNSATFHEQGEVTEFSSEEPTAEIQSKQTSRQLFAISDVKETTEEEDERCAETKRNVANLSSWDEDFDALADDETPRRSKRRLMPVKITGGRRLKFSGNKKRRQSEHFSRGGKRSLIDPVGEDAMETL